MSSKTAKKDEKSVSEHMQTALPAVPAATDSPLSPSLQTRILEILHWSFGYADLCVLAFSTLAALLYAQTLPDTDPQAFRFAVVIAFMSGLIFRFAIEQEEPRTQPRDVLPGLADELARLVVIIGVTIAITMFCAGVPALPVSLWLVWSFAAIAATTVLYMGEIVLRSLLNLPQVPAERIVIVCAGQQGQTLVERLTSDGAHVKILGFFDDRKGRIKTEDLHAPFLGGTDEIVAFCRENKVDRIVVALPGFAEKRLAEIMGELDILATPIYISPDIAALRQPRAVFGRVGSIAMAELSATPIRGWRAAIKRLEDIIVALVAILIFSPVFIAVPILIKLESKGPVFYRQKRFGYNNRLFDCLKFRSMYTEHCEASRKEIKLTERDDPRVTKIGKFLRASSLDELPQLLNVLLGDMSIVGPRPHPPGVKAGNSLYEDVVDQFARRYRIRPGLTGWAQINGLRGNTFTEDDIRRRFEYDMYYIQNWSLWLDIVIIIRTMVLGFAGKNAF